MTPDSINGIPMYKHHYTDGDHRKQLDDYPTVRAGVRVSE